MEREHAGQKYLGDLQIYGLNQGIKIFPAYRTPKSPYPEACIGPPFLLGVITFTSGVCWVLWGALCILDF